MDKKTIAVITHTFPFGTMQDSFFDDEINMLMKSFDLVFVPTASAKSRQRSPRLNLLKDAVRLPGFQMGISWSRIRWIVIAIKTVLADFIRYELKTMHTGTLRGLLVMLVWTLKTPVELLSSNICAVYSFWGTDIGYYGKLLAKFKAVPLLVRFHRYDLYEESGSAVAFNRSLFADKGVTCVFLGDGARDYAASISQISNSKVIPLFVRDSPFNGLDRSKDPKTLNVISISSDEPKKRLDKIHDVLRSLQSKYDYKVAWKHYGRLASSRPLFETDTVSPINISYMGMMTQQQLREVLMTEKVDFVLFMSDSEGIPYSMLQAMSFGIPVFSTDVGEISSVKLEEYSWLFDVEDEIDSVSNQIHTQLPLIRSQSVRQHVQAVCQNQFGREDTYDKIVLSLSQACDQVVRR